MSVKQSIDRNNQLKRDIIKKTYELYSEKGARSPVEMIEVAERIGIKTIDNNLPSWRVQHLTDQQLIIRLLSELGEDGLIEKRAANYCDFWTTPEGREYAEILIVGKKTETNFPTPITNNTINISGNISGSNLQQDSHNSTQSINNPDELLQGIAVLLKEIDESQVNLSIKEESKSEFQADIDTLKAQIQSSNPKGSILKESLASIQRILEGAAGSVVPELIKSIPSLLSMIL